MIYFNQATYNPATYELTLIKHTVYGDAYTVQTLKTAGVYFPSNPTLHNKNGVLTWQAKPNKVWYVKDTSEIDYINGEWVLTKTVINEFDLNQTSQTILVTNIHIRNNCINYQYDGKEYSLMFDSLELKRVVIEQTVYQNNMLVITIESSALLSFRWGVIGLIVEIN